MTINAAPRINTRQPFPSCVCGTPLIFAMMSTGGVHSPRIEYECRDHDPRKAGGCGRRFRVTWRGSEQIRGPR